MKDPRREQPLSDAALEREIEQALAVDPSPEFVARVRTHVAAVTPRQQVSWRVRWGLVTCAAVGAMVLGIAYLEMNSSGTALREQGGNQGGNTAVQSGSQGPDGSQPISNRVETPTVARLEQGEGPTGRTDASSAGSKRGGSQAPVRPARNVRLDLEPFPEVMISASEVRAMRQVLMLAAAGVEMTPLAEASATSDVPKVSDIVIEPITIDPIVLAKIEGAAE